MSKLTYKKAIAELIKNADAFNKEEERQEKAKKKAILTDAPKEKIARNVIIPESSFIEELFLLKSKIPS